MLVPVFTGGACLVILATFVWSHFQNQANTIDILERETIIWADGMSRALAGAKQALVSASSEIQDQPIEAIHDSFQKLTFDQPLFREVSLLVDGRIVCTSFRIPETPVRPDNPERTIIPKPGEIHIVPSSPTDKKDASITLNYRLDDRSVINVLIAQQSLIGPLRFKRAETVQGIFFLRGDCTLLMDSSIGPPLDFQELPKQGLSITKDGLIYCTKVDGFDLYTVSFIPGNRVVQNWVNELPIYGMLAVVAATLFLLGGWRLHSRLGGLRAELEEAIDLNQIEAYLQPVLNLENNRCRGAEALMRWRHPQRGLIPPTLFIPEAERSGLITEMTFTMIENIARDLEEVFQKFPDFRVNINLSSVSLNEPDFCNRCLALLKNRIPLSQLCFEITESAYLGPAAVDRLHEFHRQGIKLVVDDFGTGYSNLRYLMDYPFDSLKIDKAFVDGINPDGQTSGLVDHIIQIGKSCRLSLVGEGIEKEFQADYLRRAGVEFGQGYFFARPMAGDEFAFWIKKQEKTAEADRTASNGQG